MKPRATLRRVRRGDVANIAFADFVALVEAFGFRLKRVSGSHHTYTRLDVVNLNLQPRRGQAKSYQVRQFLNIVERRGLQLENGDD